MLQVQFDPFPILHTTKLILRKPEITDAQDFFELRSNEQVMQYVNRPIAKTIEDAQNLLTLILDKLKANEGINWTIALHIAPHKVIGNIGIWQLQKEDYRGEIGYMLHPNYWRMGIMQDAITAVLHYGFNQMKLHSIEAKTSPLNIASALLLKKTGFLLEAHFQENCYWNGSFGDTTVYSLLAHNYKG